MVTDHRKPFNVALFLASQIIYIPLAVPAFIPRPAKVIIFAGLGWYSYQVCFTQTTGDFSRDYGIGSMVALDIALLTPPEKLRSLHDKDQTSVIERSLKKRVIWALKLFSNPRRIGLAHERASHLPPRPSSSTPRSRFVLSRIFLAIGCLLISFGTTKFHAAYATTTTADKLALGAPFHWRALLVLSFGLTSVCTLFGANSIISAIIVGCGLSSPERWPLLFGSPLEAWSIKRFWRIFWHQMIRGYVLSYTSFVLRCFFPASYVGTTSYKLARMYIVFCISGIVHLSGDVMATGELGFKSFTFFLLQPIGITIEIIVSYLWHQFQQDQTNRHKTTVNAGTAQEKHYNGNKNGKSLPEEPIPPAWVRCVGYVWVTLWMVWTGAYLVDVTLLGLTLS